jgi:hypothetical protein
MSAWPNRRRRDGGNPRVRHRLALLHGVYYLITGAWPLLSMRTFQWVTGPKVDRWLVRMVGILAAVIGGALVRDGPGRDATRRPDAGLAVASALGFTAVDVVYVARGRISRVYLLDAVMELGLVVAWLRRR